LIILNGKEIQEKIKQEIKEEISKGYKPTLAILQIGNLNQSNVYVNQKKIHAYDCNIETVHKIYAINTTEEELIASIKLLNNDNNINGIIVQLPLPSHLSEFNILEAILPIKDVDCMTSTNIGLLHIQRPIFKPCTSEGIIEIMKRYNILLESKNVLIIGRSNIVSRPLAELLLQENCTVTISHSKTKEIKKMLMNYDIIISAIGKANFLTLDDFKRDNNITDKILIDVGINRDINGKLCGDISKEIYNNKESNISHITPTPNGIGRMTVACLLRNVLKAYKIQNNIKTL